MGWEQRALPRPARRRSGCRDPLCDATHPLASPGLAWCLESSTFPSAELSRPPATALDRPAGTLSPWQRLRAPPSRACQLPTEPKSSRHGAARLARLPAPARGSSWRKLESYLKIMAISANRRRGPQGGSHLPLAPSWLHSVLLTEHGVSMHPAEPPGEVGCGLPPDTQLGAGSKQPLAA